MASTARLSLSQHAILTHSSRRTAAAARTFSWLPLSSSPTLIKPVHRSISPSSTISSRYFSVSSTSSSSSSSNNSAKMGASDLSLLDAIANRRSIYALKKSSAVSDARIRELVTQAIKDVPSSFNSQSTRLVVLVKDDHDKFWNIVTEILKPMVPEANWEHTQQRMNMFAGAYGTILFYEDPEPIKQLQSKFAIYADKFPTWSEHTSAMHQYALWTALEAEGLGANLQHYNPVADQKAAETFGLPLEWSLKAQLVFGDPANANREDVKEKTFEPVEQRVKFFGL